MGRNSEPRFLLYSPDNREYINRPIQPINNNLIVKLIVIVSHFLIDLDNVYHSRTDIVSEHLAAYICIQKGGQRVTSFATDSAVILQEPHQKQLKRLYCVSTHMIYDMSGRKIQERLLWGAQKVILDNPIYHHNEVTRTITTKQEDINLYLSKNKWFPRFLTECFNCIWSCSQLCSLHAKLSLAWIFQPI